jgi:phosphoribosylanthranilate isomerase
MPVESGTQRSYSWPPRVQVAGLSSLREALFCKKVGVDCLGFTLGLPGGIHDGMTEEKAAYTISRLPEGMLPLVITYVTSGQEAYRLVTDIGAAAIQFHGGISAEEILLFRKLCPSVKTIGLVTVTGAEAINKAAQFTAPTWDCIILDSLDLATGRTGATGCKHDWNISAEITKRAQVPVILAGGLNPDNVVEAISHVRPDGVDAHTGLEDRDGTRNFMKIRAFAREALKAFNTIKRTPEGHDQRG